MANFVYVDNSNLWIEGTHLSAVVSGLAPDIVTAQEQGISDHSWKIDFRRLYEFVTDGDEIGRAVLFGSRTMTTDALWTEAGRRGFEVIVYDRNVRGKEKMVDISMATAMMADSYERMTVGVDEITLVAGDADYVPTVESLRERGFDVFVTFWQHAARELKVVATQFIPMNDYLDYLRHS